MNTYSYQWANQENTHLLRTDEQRNVLLIPCDEDNTQYKLFLASNQTVAAFIEPPPPAELTTAEKLSKAGLSVSELKELLDLN